MTPLEVAYVDGGTLHGAPDPRADMAHCGRPVEPLRRLDDLFGWSATAVCDECMRGGRRCTIVGARGAYRIEYRDGTMVQVGEPNRPPTDWVQLIPFALYSVAFVLAVIAVLMTFDVL